MYFTAAYFEFRTSTGSQTKRYSAESEWKDNFYRQSNDGLKFLGHVIRKETLEDLSLAGKFEGKRARGGQRKQFIKHFEFGSARHLWNLARNRTKWRKVVRQTPDR